jgi:DNA-binding response OmpR family regulator
MNETLTVLIYHPNRILVGPLVQFLQAAGYSTLSTSQDDEVTGLIKQMRPPVLLVAALLEDDLGLVERVQTTFPSTRLAVLAETDEIVERALAMGVDEVVLYDEADIGGVLEAVDRLFRASGSTESEGISLLIVDDEADSADMLSEYLTGCGYRTTVARSGREGLAILKKKSHVRVVLLDINLPDVGGVEVLRDISGLRTPPAVIMVTALSDSVIAKHALKMGACDYLVKPIDLRALDQAITACLARQLHRGRHWWTRREA